MKVAIVLAGLLLVFVLSTNIDNYAQGYLLEKDASFIERDTVYKVIGEFGDYLSWLSFLNADIFFHGGIRKEDCPLTHALMGEGFHLKDDAHAEHTDDHGGGHKAHVALRPSLNILPDIGRAVTITDHTHLSGETEKELLPWLYYAVKLNPYNHRAYAVSGYWVGIRLKKPKSAIRFLREGLIKNPGSWQIYKTIGEIYFYVEKDYKKSIQYFEIARRLGGKEGIDKFEKRAICVLLAEAYNKIGEVGRSLVLYKDLLELFPGDRALKERVLYFRNLITP